ncbi:MAG: helix-turn-helix domain-containing protein [Chloroflexota bacterium]|nr:helix-turn-helix domain-containing protein [Chloroflexota bacterium]
MGPSPERLVRMLDSRHVYELGQREQVLLALLWLGYGTEEIAVIVDRSPATVRRWVAALTEQLLGDTDVGTVPRYLRAWTWRHLGCCARGTARRLEALGRATGQLSAVRAGQTARGSRGF